MPRTLQSSQTIFVLQMVSRIIDKITEWIGRPMASVYAVAFAAADLVWGYESGWASTWINGTSAGTGLLAIILLFLLQHSTNRGNRALHAKLDALIALEDAIDNRLIGSEGLPEVEIRSLQEEAVLQVKKTVEEVVDK
jgi:low affinity Fe/Cu permease